MKASHRTTLESIPWMVTGRIENDDRISCERHMSECAECRAEFELQQKVHRAMTAESTRVEYAPGASLQKLMARIDNEEALPTASLEVRQMVRSRPRVRLSHWLAAAVVVEAIGITLLAANNAPQTTVNVPPAYVTVTNAQATPQTAVLRVVFADDYSVREMSAALQTRNLSIIDGPKSGNIFTLGTSESDQTLANTLPQTLAMLRANPKVRLAEPIDRGLAFSKGRENETHP